ncbi:hypothetical protein ACFO3O_22020 [Dokdonia ponticola]|uniref:Uncharacterized protein n=1 Tax=Dokdonia ponticola TaxID=2041041 RepID=A0ABV9I397_9FLAO
MKSIQGIPITSVVIFFTLTFFAQATAQKIIIPKTGIIVFEKLGKVTNQKLYDSTLSILNSKMKIMFRKEITDGFTNQEIDYNSNYVEDIIDMSMQTLDFGISGDNLKKYHVFNDSTITSYRKLNDKIQGDYQLINRNTQTYSMRSKIDSTIIPIMDNSYEYLDEDRIIISEYKDQNKIINGLDCFKVVLTKIDKISSDEGISLLYDELENPQTTYVLYVTESLKCKYHPVINYKSILEKYYPLEIVEYSNLIQGIESIYSLKEFSLK